MSFFNKSNAQNPNGESTFPEDDNNEFLNPASSRSLGETAWSQERTSQHQDFHEEMVGGRAKRLGCCSRYSEVFIKFLHFLDASLGLAAIVYGSLLMTQFEEPAMSAALCCVILGTILLGTSLLGIFSLFVRKCSRCGLAVSSFIAPYLAIVYFTGLIALLANQKGFLMYLEEHKDVMYLKDDVVQNVKGLMPLLYTVLVLLSVLEVMRFIGTRRMRERLLRSDAADIATDYISVASKSSRKSNKGLTEALLEGGEVSSAVETANVNDGGDGEGNWWEK